MPENTTTLNDWDPMNGRIYKDNVGANAFVTASTVALLGTPWAEYTPDAIAQALNDALAYSDLKSSETLVSANLNAEEQAELAHRKSVAELLEKTKNFEDYASYTLGSNLPCPCGSCSATGHIESGSVGQKIHLSGINGHYQIVFPESHFWRHLIRVTSRLPPIA